MTELVKSGKSFVDAVKDAVRESFSFNNDAFVNYVRSKQLEVNAMLMDEFDFDR